MKDGDIRGAFNVAEEPEVLVEKLNVSLDALREFLDGENAAYQAQTLPVVSHRFGQLQFHLRFARRWTAIRNGRVSENSVAQLAGHFVGPDLGDENAFLRDMSFISFFRPDRLCVREQAGIIYPRTNRC